MAFMLNFAGKKMAIAFNVFHGQCCETYATAIPSWKHQFPYKNTEVKQLGPWLALGWVIVQGLVVDAVAIKYCKIPESENCGQKNCETSFFETNLILGLESYKN